MHPCVDTSSVSSVRVNSMIWNAQPLGSNINITISSGSASPANQYTIEISNVKNCHYAASFRNVSISANGGSFEQFNGQSIVTYTAGSIRNCALNFEGTTGLRRTNMSINFVTSNEVGGNSLGVRIQYSSYFSSTLDLASFYTEATPKCSLFLNSVEVASAVDATVSTF